MLDGQSFLSKVKRLNDSSLLKTTVMYKMVVTMSLQLCWVPEKVYQSGKWMILSVKTRTCCFQIQLQNRNW